MQIGTLRFDSLNGAWRLRCWDSCFNASAKLQSVLRQIAVAAVERSEGAPEWGLFLEGTVLYGSTRGSEQRKLLGELPEPVVPFGQGELEKLLLEAVSSVGDDVYHEARVHLGLRSEVEAWTRRVHELTS